MISQWCADPTVETARLYRPPLHPGETEEVEEFPVDGHWRCLFERKAGKSPTHNDHCTSPRCREAADCTCPCHTPKDA